jgi:hypothetical protein
MLLFNTKYFPVTEMSWNSFAAELHFYRKGLAGSFVLHGIAILDRNNQGAVTFNIQHAEYANEPVIINEKSILSALFKPYFSFYRKSSELLLYPFKRKTTTGVFQ